MNPTSEHAITLMRTWLNNHGIRKGPLSKSSTGAKKGAMPKRLLKIDATSNIVCLEDSLEAQEYALLSYCWGGDQTTKTLASNLQAHKTNVITDSLPQTIRDAIKVTKHLGLEYLWVDALCK
jgi:hypothetical protein